MTKKPITAITGPVIPLPTPFTKDGEVDYKAMDSYVRFLIQNGIKNVMTTVGTSRYNLLTEEEVMKVNATVVKAAENKAVTIVANPPVGGTMHAVRFARHAEEIGADYFLAYYPERYYGEENTYRYFEALNKELKSTDILIHEMPMRNGYGPGTVQYSIPLMNRLLDLEHVAGVKEEALDHAYSNQMVEAISDRAIVIGAGGGMSRYYLRDHSRGSHAFLGGIGNFIPRLELDFFARIQSGNQAEAGKIVNETEMPYFEKVVPLGWHPSLKCALSLMGLMPEYERAPMITIEGKDKEMVRALLAGNGWLKG